MRWPNVGLLRAWRAKKPMLCPHAVTDEDCHPLENEDESEAEDFVTTGARLSKHAPRVRDITTSKIYCSMFRKLPTTSVGSLVEANLTNSLPRRRNLHLALTEFRMALTDVRRLGLPVLSFSPK